MNKIIFLSILLIASFAMAFSNNQQKPVGPAADAWNELGQDFFAKTDWPATSIKKIINSGLPPKALANALHFFNENDHRIDNQDVLVITDFTQPAYRKRLFVIHNDGRFETHLVAHGYGSGGLGATPHRFGDRKGKNETPPGFLITTDDIRSSKKRPYAILLEGLERRNRNSSARGILFHGTYKYVRENPDRSTGFVGRSEGCLTVDSEVAKKIAPIIRGGSLIYNYTPFDR
jgi:hypothetical protein